MAAIVLGAAVPIEAPIWFEVLDMAEVTPVSACGGPAELCRSRVFRSVLRRSHDKLGDQDEGRIAQAGTSGSGATPAVGASGR